MDWILLVAMAALLVFMFWSSRRRAKRMKDEQEAKARAMLPGVKVLLEKQDGKAWTQLSSGVTNEQGRITALYPQDKALEKGTYRVTFQTGEWFAAHKTASFFPEVPVIFAVDGTVPHYHIPLLLSPYGFSTYRGS